MSFPEKVSKQILKKSKRHCGFCYKFCGRDIELHHIIPEIKGGKNTINNCIPLCFNCHSDVGHYNTDHPKGKKIQPEELKSSRDKLFELINDGKIPFNDSEEFQTKTLILARIEMDELNCLWDRPKHTDSELNLVFHEKALFQWPNEKVKDENRTVDPIFDITLINSIDLPLTLNRLGIQLKDFWQKLKGISSPQKVRSTHSYKLTLDPLIEEPKQYLKLDDPIFIPSQSPYRFTLRLKNYHSSVPTNCIVINIIFDSSIGKFESDSILLGNF